MARRRRQSAAEDLFEITSRFPWWVGVVLAIVSYLVLHHFAAGNAPPATDAGAVGNVLGHTLLKTLAAFGQFVFPTIFLLGALLSAVSTLKAGSAAANEFPNLESPVRKNKITPVLPDEIDLRGVHQSVEEERSLDPIARGWSIELLNAIDWKRFEEVCAEFFRICGFESETQSHGPDGGIDIRLYAKSDRSHVENIVQCKQRTRGAIGPKPLRELLGVMAANGIARGTFVTSSRFNDEARRFAKENRIYLIDGKLLVEKILARPAEEQQRILDVATEGDYLTPSCPSCGIKLVKRENRKDKSQFWGCRSYPSCRYTLKLASS